MASNKYLLDMPTEVAEDLEEVVALLNEYNAPFRCSKKDVIVIALKKYLDETKIKIQKNELTSAVR